MLQALLALTDLFPGASTNRQKRLELLHTIVWYPNVPFSTFPATHRHGQPEARAHWQRTAVTRQANCGVPCMCPFMSLLPAFSVSCKHLRSLNAYASGDSRRLRILHLKAWR